jgi:protein-S-isoprenylcysteine O-methyltransferase Ste14
MFVAGYALITLLAAALSIWAWRLFVRVPKSSAPPPGERS